MNGSYLTGFGQLRMPASQVGTRIAAALDRMQKRTTTHSDVRNATTEPWGCSRSSEIPFCVPLNQYQSELASDLEALLDPAKIPNARKLVVQLQRGGDPYKEFARLATSAWTGIEANFEFLADWVYRARTTRVGQDRLPEWRWGPDGRTEQRVNQEEEAMLVAYFNPIPAQHGYWIKRNVMAAPGRAYLDPAMRQIFVNMLKLSRIKKNLEIIDLQVENANLAAIEEPPIAIPPNLDPANAAKTATPSGDTGALTPALGVAAVLGIGWWLWRRTRVQSP